MTAPIKPAAPILACLLLALSVAAGGDFVQTLTPEDLRATGLVKLTPEELARLEIKVKGYKAAEAAATPTAAGAQAAAAPAKPTKILPSWVSALVTLERAGHQPDKSEAMESRLAGEFAGWSGRTSFRLENGQLWTQANNDSCAYTPALKSPKVKIYPASLGTYWLEIEEVHLRCRVKPAKME